MGGAGGSAGVGAGGGLLSTAACLGNKKKRIDLLRKFIIDVLKVYRHSLGTQMCMIKSNTPQMYGN